MTYLNLVRAFSASFESLPFDDLAAETYGRLRTALEKQGRLIGPNDLLIASIALAHGATLITHNTEEFKRVPDFDIGRLANLKPDTSEVLHRPRRGKTSEV